MKIAIIGGGGFIGHNVVINLMKLNHEVLVIDSFSHESDNTVAEVTWLHANRMERIKKQATYTFGAFKFQSYESQRVFTWFKPEIVIFMTGPSNQRQLESNKISGIESMSSDLYPFLRLMETIEIKRFVYISSSMVYGNFQSPAKETDRVNPIGLYGIFKNTAEHLVKDFTRTTGIEHTIIRPSAVYGPWDNTTRVVNKFLLNAMRNEDLVVRGKDEFLDFTYVDDVANGIVSAALSDHSVNKTYNMSRGSARSIFEVANIIVDTVGTGKVVVKDKNLDMPSRTSLNIDEAKKDIGFNPQIDIEQGIQECYKWLINSPYYLGGRWE